MGGRSDLLIICGMFLVAVLPRGVKMTALGLDQGADSSRLWLGLPQLAAGILGLECVRWCVTAVRAEPGRLCITPGEARQVLAVVRVFYRSILFGLPVVTLLQFTLLLDGHVHLRGCGWLLLAYAAGAALVWIGRKASTRWGSCYLRWGWAPVVAFGVPLGLPVLLATRLVPPTIPPL
jgi:hypothetical protein